MRYLPGQARYRAAGESGYAMAVLLVGISVMAVLLTAAMPVWRHEASREKEAELIFRGEQYARAIGLFQRRYAGAFPPSLDTLLEQKFLRRKYTDPMTEGEFQLLYQGSAMSATPGMPAAALTERGDDRQAPIGATPPGLGQGAGAQQGAGSRGGIVGVASTSRAQSIRLYNGRNRYNEWHFVYTAVSQQPQVPPGAQPGQFPGAGGQLQQNPGTPYGIDVPSGGFGGAVPFPQPPPGRPDR